MIVVTHTHTHIAIVLFLGLSNARLTAQFCNFDYGVSVNCQNLSIQFTALANQSPYQWDFGDGQSIPATNNPAVTHQYTDVNFYNLPLVHVTLNSSAGNCSKDLNIDGIFVGGGCSSQRMLSALVTNQLLPANQLVGKNLYIFGDLIVDIPYTFDNCQVMVSEGGRIIVNSGKSLSLQNGTVVGAVNTSGICNNLWKGFEVKPNATLDCNQATIQDAYFAINPVNPFLQSSVPVIKLANTTFKRNFIGIYAESGSFALSPFVNNTFEGSGNTQIFDIGTCNPPAGINGVPFARRTYCGIYFEGWNGGGSLLLKGANNVFKDLQAGVICLNATANISGCQFQRIKYLSGNTAPHQATAVTFIDHKGGRRLTLEGMGKNGLFTIQNCERGVYARSVQAGTSVSVKNCRIEAVQNGVEIETDFMGNFTKTSVDNCYIGCTLYTPNLKMTTSGVEIKDGSVGKSEFSISYNDIDVNQSTIFTPYVQPGTIPTGVYFAGLQTQASQGSTKLDIFNNHVNLMHGLNGIMVHNAVNASILGNTITNTTISFDQFVGIGVYGGYGNTLNCNLVSASPFGGSIGIYLGIFCSASPGVNMTENTTINESYGVACQFDNETSCSISYNDITNTDNNPASYGLGYGDAITGPQYLKGNDWVGDFFAGGIFFHNFSNVSYCLSLYHVSADANVANSINPILQGLPQTCSGVASNWFTILEMEEGDLNCLPGVPPPSRVIAKNDADLNLAGGGTTSLSPGFKWTSEMGLYRKFTEYPALAAGDAVINGFLQAQQGGPIAATYAVRNGVNGMETLLSPALLTNIQNTLAQLESNEANLLALLENFNSIPNAASSYAALVIQRQSLELALEGYLATAANSTMLNAAPLLASNSSINCNSLPCTSERYINGLYLSTRVANPRALTATELEAVRQIAMNCPVDAGSIVYFARAWYYMETGVVLATPCDGFAPPLNGEQRDEADAASLANDWVLSPNPADETVSIQLPAGVSPTEIRIFDVSGKLRYRHFMAQDTSASLELPVANFDNGIYFVSIIAGDTAVLSKKLSIQH